MSRLAAGNPRWAGDDGRPDPAVRARLAAQDGEHGYFRALAAVGGARLLLPIVASGDDSADGPDPDRQAELAAVTLKGSNGEQALLAFTGIDSLQAWDRHARPVLCTIDQLAATVTPAGAQVLLIDVAGPDPLLIGADVVAELAQGRRLVELDDGGFGWMFHDPDRALHGGE